MGSPDVLTRLDGEGGRSAREVVAALGLSAAVTAGGRPRVVADMVASVDGRAAVDGRSVALGNPADRALLRELRCAADAILVGTGTLRAERYASLLDDDQRARRVASGRAEHPIVATVSRRLELPVDEAPLFGEPGVPIVVFTESSAAPPPVAAALTVVRFAPGTLTLAGALGALATDSGVRGVLCEGGPSLLRRLIAEDALDDLLLTVAPLAVGGAGPGILDGDVLGPPAPRLALRDVHRSEDHLFLHYGLQP
ncbi:dihydrofolate reductase family protein [Conexibacter woesei]|uniref:dihydrofolate reductase family protein n=1 Tax=Conexibacter woesei TaxID=191495 RepID=UPI000428949A|nr:dihydrofolate reductase family protein [Conexibacter woesei]